MKKANFTNKKEGNSLLFYIILLVALLVLIIDSVFNISLYLGSFGMILLVGGIIGVFFDCFSSEYKVWKYGLIIIIIIFSIINFLPLIA